jgi:hypothetical protein
VYSLGRSAAEAQELAPTMRLSSEGAARIDATNRHPVQILRRSFSTNNPARVFFTLGTFDLMVQTRRLLPTGDEIDPLHPCLCDLCDLLCICLRRSKRDEIRTKGHKDHEGLRIRIIWQPAHSPSTQFGDASAFRISMRAMR